MKNALIACSLAPLSRNTILASVNIADHIGANKIFCHVGDDSHHVRSQIQLILNDCGVVNPTIIIRQGKADHVILSIAKELKVDLIIAGAISHEKSLVGIWGSVARRLVRYAHCSVLLLTEIPEEFKGFITIAAKIEYESSSNGLTHMAIAMARHYNASLHLIHEYDYHLRVLSTEQAADQKQIADVQRDCAIVEQERMRDYLASFQWQGIKPQAVCLPSKDQSETNQYLINHAAELLITPAPLRQWAFWERFFNIPVESILLDMPCSILFYRQASYAN